MHNQLHKFAKKSLSIAVVATSVTIPMAVEAAFERTIEAPGGVGDVVALTNALTELNALAAGSRNNARIWLSEGTYDLSGLYMYSSHHLRIETCNGGLLAGLGDRPGATILLGGGEAGAHGVLSIADAGNWGCFTVSNLTVTGGWTAGDGGGIESDPTNKGNVDYRCLIVSNNYAAGSLSTRGGGGCYNGRAFQCLFENNRTGQMGGGFIVSGKRARFEDEGQGAWNCAFTNNTAANGGGIAIKGGQCVGCEFYGNSSTGGGGGAYVGAVSYETYSGNLTNTTRIVGCQFLRTTGEAVYCDVSGKAVSMSNCVVSAGSGNTGTLRFCDMVDCQVVANTNAGGIVRNCHMNRCTVRGNAVTSKNLTIDSCDAHGSHTNVNCLIEANGYLSPAYGPVFKNKVFVNCTIVGNDAANSNYGCPIDACALWNCVLWGNKIGSTLRDVRTKIKGGGEYSMALTNCVFVSSDLDAADVGVDGAVTHEGFGGCRQVAKSALKLVDEPNGDYTPKTRSPLYNTGLADDWVVALVGGMDLAGKRRLFGSGLDVGAYESQRFPPGFLLSVW